MRVATASSLSLPVVRSRPECTRQRQWGEAIAALPRRGSQSSKRLWEMLTNRREQSPRVRCSSGGNSTYFKIIKARCVVSSARFQSGPLRSPVCSSSLLPTALFTLSPFSPHFQPPPAPAITCPLVLLPRPPSRRVFHVHSIYTQCPCRKGKGSS